MEQVYLINYRSNYKEIEREERYRFLNSILERLGIDKQIEIRDGGLDIAERVKLHQIEEKYDIRVIEEIDGSMDIYCDGEKIGVWEKPRYVLKRDYGEIDRKRAHYVEMHCKYWTILDEE